MFEVSLDRRSANRADGVGSPRDLPGGAGGFGRPITGSSGALLL